MLSADKSSRRKMMDEAGTGCLDPSAVSKMTTKKSTWWPAATKLSRYVCIDDHCIQQRLTLF
jgi:hypothetical protein